MPKQKTILAPRVARKNPYNSNKRKKSSGKEWEKRVVFDSGEKRIATLTHKALTKDQYNEFKTGEKVSRQRQFGSLTGTPDSGGNFKAAVSATIRRKNAGSKRPPLADAHVINPGFSPVKNNKSHLVADRFGGPTAKENLINEEHSINLSAHKVIENRIAKIMDARIPNGEKAPTKRRGSMVVVDHFEDNVSVKRVYAVHMDAGNNQKERFDMFTMTRSKNSGRKN